MRTVYPVYNLEAIEKEWGLLVPFFSRLVDDHMSLDDIWGHLESGEWHLWIDDVDGEIVSIAVTSFIYYPQYTALRIILTAGSETDWAAATEFLENVAKANRCDTVEILGRKGWERALKSRGFEFQNITLRKRLR